MRRQVTLCPVCDAPLRVSELSCTRCPTRLHGAFPSPPLARLASEHQAFIETFVCCRGIIRDVERVLGVSYPTVRARLDAAVAALEEVKRESEIAEAAPAASSLLPPDRRRELLEQVVAGLLDPAEAAEALRRLA